jgi:hypothetical protein
MKPDSTSNRESMRVLLEAELDRVAGGMAASQVWVSPLAIHGFNPQPDPPAIWGSHAPLGTAGHA